MFRFRLAIVLALSMTGLAAATELGIDGTRFTIDGKPTFLLGLSYYGALGAPQAFIQKDLDDMQHLGVNWIRVWATWAAFENDMTAVDGDGRPREPYFSRLERLVAECDRRGMIVDVTLTRGNGVVGPPRIRSLETHRRAVETIVSRLKSYRNWYVDLGNERNIRDPRYVPFEDLAELREAAKRIDPGRLVTASHAGDIPPDDLKRYVLDVEVDFISPHRPRNARSASQTEERSREYLAEMRKLGRVVPVHYQEPFRRGFTKGWEPTADDFVTDLRGARAGGAAGWCLHNGDQRHVPDQRPRRSFDMREKRLFEQLDAVEREALSRIHAEIR
jgi:hypothetical protein